MRTLHFAPLIGVALLVGAAFAQPPAEKVDLLNFAKGDLPNDTGSDKKTYSLADQPGLGKCLKVDFPAGDSVGVRLAKVTDWKRYATVEFDAFNPGKNDIKFGFNVAHRRSTNYHTRIEAPFTLKPGKSRVRLGIDEMVNVNGSAPDLAHVTRWFIASQSDKPVTAYFGAITLEGGEAAAAPVAPAGGLPANTAFRVQGTIGDLKVDLLITPVPLKAPSPPAKVSDDPARLKRIRAAKMPKFDKPVMFDTPEADAILSALEVFPPDNPWNLVVSDWPLHPNSKNIIASIGVDKPMRYNADMGFVLIPPRQKKVDVKLGGGADESDKGPYPVPDNMPIEGWPLAQHKGKKLSLDEIQRLKEDSDRHGIVVDPVNRMLYEFYQAHKTDKGWEASCEATFDLKSNKQRPDGWTSSDAAGLPIFPAVVRYDELKRGAIEHALRVTVVKTRRAYVYPATHYASPHTDENLPRMGERIRLRQDFDVSGFSPEVQTILKALKKYGMFVADNGIDWAVSVAPDPRIPVMNEELRKIKGSDFEVVTPPAGYKQPK
ncbi:MAG: hypothetical protein U0793_15355 [Gemmataceae bacterium]